MTAMSIRTVGIAGGGNMARGLLERLCAFGIELNQRHSTDGFGFKFLPGTGLAESPEKVSA
jgi:hypothetical protein